MRVDDQDQGPGHPGTLADSSKSVKVPFLSLSITAARNAERWSAPAVRPRHILRTSDGVLALDLRARRCLVRQDGTYIDVSLTKLRLPNTRLIYY